MAINNNLEEDLQSYYNTQDSDLFEDKLYLPLKYMAASICKKFGIKQDIDEVINDMVSSSILKLSNSYDKSKGTTKAAIYIYMSQYLSKQLQYNNRNKRSSLKTLYIEDLNKYDGHTVHLIEVEVDELIMMKQTFLEKQEIFKQLKTKLQRKIAEEIINFVESGSNEYVSNYAEYIASKCKCSDKSVYSTIIFMRNLMEMI